METLDPRLVTFSAPAIVNMDKLQAAGRATMDQAVPRAPAQQLVFLQEFFPEAPHVKRLTAIDLELALLLV